MKKEFDDDNRVVADMSSLEDRGLVGSWFGMLDPSVRAKYGPGSKRQGADQASNLMDGKPAGMSQSTDFKKKKKRALIFYAMKYSFAIGMVFLTAFGLLILLLTILWK